MSSVFIAIIIATALLISLISSLPVTFCLIGVSMICFLVFSGPSALYMCVGAAINQISVEVYLAIPLFIFMGSVMQHSGIARQLYDTMLQWTGPLRGGLAMGTVASTTIIDALSGIGATGTTMMGLVALPEMYRRNYNKRIVLGCISAGGALGPLIPPSVLMIIVGGYTQLSVGKLFMGGIIPGLLVSFSYCVYIGIRCFIRKEDGPPLAMDERLSWLERVVSLKYVIMPIALIIMILEMIYTGVCTPTEAGSIGALGSLVIAGINRQLSWSNLKGALTVSLKITCMCMWILIGGGCYSALVTSTGTGHLVSDVVTNLSLGPYGTLLVILFIPYILGMFIDPIAIVMICVPMFIPIIKSTGLDMLWVILLFIMTVIVGYITPPFGMNLFYMKGVAPPETRMSEIYRGVIPFVLVKSAVLVACIIFPFLMTGLPSLIK